MIYKLLSFSLICFSISRCNHTQSSGVGSRVFANVSKGSWGNLNYSLAEGIYFSGQPNVAQIKALKSKGIKVIINLRSKSEAPLLNEEKIAIKAGLSYFNVPILKNKLIDPVTIELIERLVQKHNKQNNILIHGYSIDRPATWYAIHLYTVHKITDEETILNRAKNVGLHSPNWIKKLLYYKKYNLSRSTK